MLEGKRIIVTGAAQGIGVAMARGFVDMGAKVTLADVTDPKPAAASISKRGHAIAVQADVTSSTDCARMVAETETAFGGLDGLVCNAALFATLPAQPFDQIEEGLWDQVMDVNVKGQWLCVRAAVPALKRSGSGSIVMIASNRIFRGYPDLLHYDASKGAVLAMARSLIRELGQFNIRVNTVAPGLTLSEGVLAREGIQERKDSIAAARSLARDQVPEDLVGPAAFLLSDHASFVSGQTIGVDGGGVVH